MRKNTQLGLFFCAERVAAITEGDLECILTRNCEGTEQLRKMLFTGGAEMNIKLG